MRNTLPKAFRARHARTHLLNARARSIKSSQATVIAPAQPTQQPARPAQQPARPAPVQEIVNQDDIKIGLSNSLPAKPQVTAQVAPPPLPDKHKIAVCCCGFGGEGLKYTYETIKTNIVDKLKEEFDVDVYSYISKNMDHESGSLLNQLTCMAGTTVSDVDVEYYVKKLIKSSGDSRYNDVEYVNSVKELYMESQSYKIIKEYESKNPVHYDAIVYVRPNMFIAKPLELCEVHKVIMEPNAVYCCNFNDWNGYGIGYYIGSSRSFEIITNRINTLSGSVIKSSEKLLKDTIDESKLKRYKSSMFHFKIYKDGGPDVYYQLLKKYTTADEYMKTMQIYRNSKSKLPKNKVRDNSSDDLSIVTDSKKSASSTARKHKRRSCPN